MGKARRRAESEAHAATLPARQGLRRDRRGARRDYRQGVRANEAAYGALDRTLQDIGKDYSKDYQRLGTQFGSSLSGLGGMAGFGSGAEASAGLGALGSIRQSGMRGLGQQRQRGVEGLRSSRTQGAIEEKTNSMNMLADMQNTIDELRKRRQDLDAQEGAMTASLIPGYREEIAAKREEDQFRQWLIEQMRGELGGGGGGDKGPQQANQANERMAGQAQPTERRNTLADLNPLVGQTFQGGVQPSAFQSLVNPSVPATLAASPVQSLVGQQMQGGVQGSQMQQIIAQLQQLLGGSVQANLVGGP